MLETSIIIIIPLIIGYVLGRYPYKDQKSAIELCEKHYQDMKQLTNQFADLSIQLHNQNVGAKHQQEIPQVGFPSMEEISDSDEKEELVPELQGGRL